MDFTIWIAVAAVLLSLAFLGFSAILDALGIRPGKSRVGKALKGYVERERAK